MKACFVLFFRLPNLLIEFCIALLNGAIQKLVLALVLLVLFDFLSSLDSLQSSQQNWKSQHRYITTITFFSSILWTNLFSFHPFVYPLRFLWLRDLSYEDKLEGKTGKSLKTMNFLFQPLQPHESILRSFFFKNKN